MKIDTLRALRIEKPPTVKKKQDDKRNNLRRSYLSALKNGAKSDLKISIAFSRRRSLAPIFRVMYHEV